MLFHRVLGYLLSADSRVCSGFTEFLEPRRARCLLSSFASYRIITRIASPGIVRNTKERIRNTGNVTNKKKKKYTDLVIKSFFSVIANFVYIRRTRENVCVT